MDHLDAVSHPFDAIKNFALIRADGRDPPHAEHDLRLDFGLHQGAGRATKARRHVFEFEAACNLLTLLSRLTRHELRLESLDHDVLVLAQRFAVSRTTCELLIRSLQADASLAAIVRDAYAAICTEAEDAVSNTLKGSPGEAAKLLLARAESTLNAKLMDLAIHTMERHGQNIEGVETLRDRAAALHKRYRSYGTQVHLGGESDIRALTRLAKL